MAAFTTALVGLTVGSTLASFATQRKSATAATRQADYEATLLEQNADLADQQAENALVRGAKAEQKQQSEVRQLIGSQRAAEAANNVDVGEGTALELQLSSAGLGEIDRTEIKNNTMLEQWGFKAQAADYRAKARLTRYAGKNAAANLKGQSYSTLLTGASQVADIYRKQ
jgi:hypothetical protein